MVLFIVLLAEQRFKTSSGPWGSSCVASPLLFPSFLEKIAICQLSVCKKPSVLGEAAMDF